MDEKLRKLQESGVFEHVRLDDLGRGTFRRRPRSPGAAPPAPGDAKRKRTSPGPPEDKPRPPETSLMAGVFERLRRIVSEEPGKAMHEVVCDYKGLAEHIQDVVSMYGEGQHTGFVESLKYALFNVKFHYLALESTLMQRSLEKGKNFHAKHLAYFLREYSGLHRIFLGTSLGDLVVSAPGDLEATMRERMRRDSLTRPQADAEEGLRGTEEHVRPSPDTWGSCL